MSYYAPAKVLVVYHTAEVHAEVEAFLKSIEKAMPPKAASTQGPGMLISPTHPQAVLPIQAIGEPVRATGSNEAAKTPPKHLFHLILDGVEFKSGDQETKVKNFTIRYEGEGIIDSNVAKVIKAMGRQGGVFEYTPTAIMPSGAYSPVCPPPASGCGSVQATPACAPGFAIHQHTPDNPAVPTALPMAMPFTPLFMPPADSPMANVPAAGQPTLPIKPPAPSKPAAQKSTL